MAITIHNPTPRPRQRFRDSVEYKRGKRDGAAGRAPACFAVRYVEGYAEGRRGAGRR